jgi:hypothetical protein
MTAKTMPVITQHDNLPIASGDGSAVYHVSELGRDILVVCITSYKGKSSLDLRRYYMDDDQQQWRPTSKGIRVPLEDADVLITALMSMQTAGIV